MTSSIEGERVLSWLSFSHDLFEHFSDATRKELFFYNWAKWTWEHWILNPLGKSLSAVWRRTHTHNLFLSLIFISHQYEVSARLSFLKSLWNDPSTRALRRKMSLNHWKTECRSLWERSSLSVIESFDQRSTWSASGERERARKKKDLRWLEMQSQGEHTVYWKKR